MRIIYSLLSVLIFSLLGACEENAPSSEEVVNVYTHRHYDTDKALFNLFTQQTGIKVNVVKASADELIQKLETEGQNSVADVLITVDAGRLVRAKDKGLLQPVSSDPLKTQVPAYLRDEEGYWYSLTRRARIIVYSKERVQADELSTYEALTDPQWQGRVLVRSSSNIYNQSLMASLIHHLGEAGAGNWAKGMVANFARTPKGNDRDQVKAIYAGVGDVALVNTYYIGLLLDSEDEAERAAGEAIGIFFPNQEGRGAHVNVSGAGVTRHAPHPANALALLEFLSGKEAQARYAAENYEYPVNPQVEASELLKSWGSFKSDTLPLSVLGTLNRQAVMSFDEAGWP